MRRGGSPLFELFVRVREVGIDAIDKKFAEQEKKFQAREKSFDKFNNKLDDFWKDQTEHVEDFGKELAKFHKDEQKREKTWLDSLSKITEGTEKFGKTFEETSKKVEDGSKRQTSALGKLGDALGKIQDSADKLNKTGIGIDAQLQGGDELTRQLTDIQKLADSLKDTEITIRTKIDGADEVIAKLKEIGQLTTELKDDEVVIRTRVENGPETVQTLEDINTRKREIGAEPVEISVDSSGLDQLNTDLDNTNQQLSSVQDTGTSAMQGLGTSFGDADSKARTLASGIGGNDSRSVRGSIRQMDADAHAANALPTLLGDAVSALTRFKTIMVAISVTAIPALIAGVAAAASGIAVLAAGAGALATSLGIGLAGAAASVGTAMGLARLSILATSQAAQAAIGNITGLGKGFFAFSTQLKSVEKQTKAFNELLGQLPAGSDAAAAAQERLSQSQEKQRAITELQTEWWNKYGTAAVEAAGAIDKIQVALVETVNTAGGELLPILQDFLDVGVQLTPTIDEAFQHLVEGVNEGTAELRHFLASDQGMQALENVILAIGDAAGPTFNILSNGLIVALQFAQPLLANAKEILSTLSQLARAASEWATSAEGVAQIAAAFEKVFEWTDQVLQAVKNLGAALGGLGIAFIQSGLADEMLQGFVDITQQIRDATSGAQDADSAFRSWLEAAKPILAATRGAIEALVVQLFRVVDEVTKAIDPSTGLPIMVEILDNIALAAEPLGNLLIGTFEALGPILADLIPELAQLMELFLGSTPELQVFLDTVLGLIQGFNNLPDPVQKTVARVAAFAFLLSQTGIPQLAQFGFYATATGLNLLKLGGYAVSAIGGIAQFAGALISNIPAAVAVARVALSGLITFLGGPFAAAMAAAALASVIFIVVTFDYDSANEAYDAAIENGESTGKAWADYFLTGLKGVPLLGGLVEALDEFVPTSEELGMEGGQSLVEAYKEALTDDEGLSGVVKTALEAVQATYDEQIAPFIDSVKQGWEDLKTGTEETWTALQEAISTAVEAVVAYYDSDIAPYVEEIKAAWTDLEAATSEMWTAFQELIEAAVTYVLGLYDTYIQPYVDQIVAAWEQLKADTQAAYDAIQAIIDTALAYIESLYAAYIQPYVDEIVAAWEQLKADTQSAYDAIQAVIDTALSYIESLYATYIQPFVDEIVAAWNGLKGDSDTIWGALQSAILGIIRTIASGVISTVSGMVTTVLGKFAEMARGAAAKMQEMAATLVTGSIIPDMADAIVATMRGMTDESLGSATELRDNLITIFEGIRDGTVEVNDALIQMIINSWNDLPDDVRLANEELAHQIKDTLGVSLFEDLTLITKEGMDSFQGNVTQGIRDTAAQATEEVQQIPNAIAPAFDQMGNQVVGAFEQMFQGVDPFVAMMIQAIMRMGAAMNSIGQATGAGTGGFQMTGMPTFSQAPGARRRAKGGIDDNAEPQPSTGGISSGVAPRVVYGEQDRRTREAYIVEDRPDNLPFLAEAASWFNMALAPLPGMATGGLSSQIGLRYTQVPHIFHQPPEPVDSAAKQSTVSGASGATGSSAAGTKKPSRRQRRRERRRERRQSRTTAGTSAAPTTGTSAAPTTGTAPSTAPSSAGSTPTMGTPSDTGTGSPSQQAFPSSCGNLYPVAAPTESGQVPYRDAALSQSGMVAAQAGVSADHVNAPANMTHPGTGENCGMPGQGSPPSLPYTSTGLGGPGASTIPYDQCLPAHVTGMQTGGLSGTPSGAPAGGEAFPLDWVDTPLGYWSSALGYGWPGDPSLDWPLLLPPAGWDPSVWYYTGAPSATGMARGGILKNGVRHFQGGGLNTFQLQAGLDAASGALGSPYSYEHAGDDGGFDCSGLWQYIYTAVRDGAPTPDYRWWGTYAWAGGFPGGEGVPGPIPGAMNVYTDLSGWEGDGTHTSGDIMDSPFEAIFAGVSGSSSAAGSDGIWSIGDPASIGEWGPVTPDYSVDPSGMMSQEVSSWWLCQAPAPVDIGTAPMFGPVESWMADLPGMTEPFLQDAGQQAIGTLGSGAAGGTGSTTTDYIIAALQSLGMDTTPEAISSLEALIACESSGEAGATSPDGAMGLTQLMPDTWAQFGIGGDPYDPIANIAASINYQLSRYGGLIDFCPYEKGGLALGPHLGMVGEAGRELMLPLDDSSVMSQVRAELAGGSFASEEMIGRLDNLAARVDNVASRVDHQTKVTPPAVAGAMDTRIASNPQTHRNLNKYQESQAVKDVFRGATR